MKKNIVVSGVFGLILASFYPVEAQQPTKVRKIGFLSQTGAFTANVEAFRQGMRELGYIEGQNIVIEFRSGERGAQLTQLANELVQQKVDVIVTSGPATNPAKMATEPAKTTNSQQDKMSMCNKQAGDKKGDDRKAFMKTCLSNAPAKPMTQSEKMSMCNKKTAGMAKDERSKAQSECMKAAS